jgi:hypothetical protein
MEHIGRAVIRADRQPTIPLPAYRDRREQRGGKRWTLD